MSIAQRISEDEYQCIVFNDPLHKWELFDGQLREKPGISWDHGDIALELSYLLRNQLDRTQFRLAINDWRVRRPVANIFIPDLVVVPAEFGHEFRGRSDRLAIFSAPLPLVVEIWSRSTGDHDVEAKIPEYMQRGDLEIWRIHPYEQTLTSWVRQVDGSYGETVYRDDLVRPVALPGVGNPLATLFEE